MSAEFESTINHLIGEYLHIKKHPLPYVTVCPLTTNWLEWHFVIKGPPGTPYEEGFYHGKLNFSSGYHVRKESPIVVMITPSGKFVCGRKTNFVFFDYNQNNWTSISSVRHILAALSQCFFTDTQQLEAVAGTIDTSETLKRRLARQSLGFNLRNRVFCELFPQIASKIKFILKEEESSETGNEDQAKAKPEVPSRKRRGGCKNRQANEQRGTSEDANAHQIENQNQIISKKVKFTSPKGHKNNRTMQDNIEVIQGDQEKLDSIHTIVTRAVISNKEIPNQIQTVLPDKDGHCSMNTLRVHNTENVNADYKARPNDVNVNINVDTTSLNLTNGPVKLAILLTLDTKSSSKNTSPIDVSVNVVENRKKHVVINTDCTSDTTSDTSVVSSRTETSIGDSNDTEGRIPLIESVTENKHSEDNTVENPHTS